MPHQWTLLPRQPELAHSLASELRVDPVVGFLLANRGILDAVAGRAYLDRKLTNLADPELLPGASEAADLIYSAAQAGKCICIYADYDVDGMCAAAILTECLRLEGARPRVYVPDRIEEGYGVSLEALRRLRQRDEVDLVVTVDCGITAVAEAEEARSIGLEYIVTDHHEPGDQIPAADVVVHPRLPGSQYPFGDLCGAGVAFKLAWELARRFSGQRKATERFQKFLLDSTSLAAIGTVCDVVPLAGENRILVHHGLKAIQRAPALGLKTLMEVSGLLKKRELSAGDVAFTIGPRLNACGRLGQARLGIELLTTSDEQRALELARYLDEENSVRQSLERRIFQDARAMAEESYDLTSDGGCSSIVLAGRSEQWHPGVIGIVANRMVERYHRPCVLVSMGDESGTGSGRSITGFHLQEALAACNGNLLTSGGHAMAAGLRIAADRFDRFREEFHAYARERLQNSDAVSEIRIDVEVPLHVLTPRLLNALDVLEPFGAANPSPLMLATNLEVVGTPKKIGKGERHLSFRVRQHQTTLRAIAFGFADRADELLSDDGKCCVVFSPIRNDFRGHTEVELRVRDFRSGARVSDQEPTT